MSLVEPSMTLKMKEQCPTVMNPGNLFFAGRVSARGNQPICSTSSLIAEFIH
jgi:hypothetical protein